MPKSKEFFSLLKTQGKITDAKFDELIEKVPDFEISQEAVQAFEDKFLTIDRAATHTDVHRRIKLEVLNPISRDLEKIISTVATVDKQTADRLESLTRDLGGAKGPDTYKRMELLSNSLGELFNKVKTAPAGGDEELKRELEAKKKVIEEFSDKFTNAEKEYKTQLSHKEKEFESKLHDYKLDGELEKLSGTFTLAEAYDKNRPAINKVILSELKSTNSLRLGTKDGQTVINVLDERGEPRYNGNSPVIINQLLEEKYKPFLKQSNADSTDRSTSQTSAQSVTVKPQNPTVRRGVSTTVK